MELRDIITTSQIRSPGKEGDYMADESFRHQLCSGLEHLKEEMKNSSTPMTAIRASLEELRRETRTTVDTVAEMTAPIRIAVEDLKREMTESGKNAGAKALGIELNSEEGVTDDRGINIPANLQMMPNTATGKVLYSAVARTSHSQAPLPLATITRAAQPNYNIAVQSVEPAQTSEGILSKIKAKVDVVSMGIGINKIRKARNQKVIIACNSEDNRNKLGEKLNEITDLRVKHLENKNPTLKLMGVIHDIEDAQIPAAMVQQNKNILSPDDKNDISIIKRTSGRNKYVTNIVVGVTPIIWNKLVDRRIHLGYQIVHVVDQSPVLQCYKCLGFGHTARVCEGGQRCGYCADNHDTRECENKKKNGQPKCLHCPDTRDGHPAYSSECPEWQRWDRVARSRIAYF